MAARLPRTALVLSTTPPFPRHYGNRNRVRQTLEFLRASGYSISFLLYPFDEEWTRGIPDYYKQLAEQFDYFSVIPNSRALHQQAVGFHHGIDEWWDENIERQLTWLLARKRFDVLFVNYTFLSKAFLAAGDACLKLLDTHDQFTDRREIFERFGAPPEFFYTTADQEAIAFDRADAVIAIKASEADFIRAVTNKPVFAIPYWDSDALAKSTAGRGAQVAFDHERPLRLGFIGAANSVNSLNLRRFLNQFYRHLRLYDLPVRVIVAGGVCAQIGDDYPFVERVGRVEDLADFYHNIDAVIAPLEFSTGIKIKIGEALAWGVPVLATRNAFDGFQDFHAGQSARDVAELCEVIASVATNESSLEPLVAAGRRSARAAARAQDRGFAALRDWMRKKSRRIVVATGRPFWDRATFVDEQIAQAVEYFSHMFRTIVIHAAGARPRRDAVYAEADWIGADEAEIPNLLGEISAACASTIAVLCDATPLALEGELPADVRGWRLEASVRVDGLESATSRLHGIGCAPTFQIAPLRYLPIGANVEMSASLATIIVAENASEWEASVAEFAVELCRLRGLESSIVRAPDRYESDLEFYARMKRDGAARWLLIGDRDWTGFVCQFSRYRDAECLIAQPDFVTPHASTQARSPSLVEALEAFLGGKASAVVTAGANSGWGLFWDHATAEQG